LNLVLKHGYDTSFETLENQGWSLTFSNYAEIADSFVAGDLDCFAYTAGTDVPLIHTIEEHTDVVILPIGQKTLDILSAKFKTGVWTIPPGAYKCAASPIQTLGDYTCIIVRKDFPENLVYAMTELIWKNKAMIEDVAADFGALSPGTAAPEGLPVHPGARRFWDELRQKNSK
jgi:TRAP transporter TAXI family solute receptor